MLFSAQYIPSVMIFPKEKIVSGVEKALPELDSPEDWATDNLKTSFEGEPKR